MASINDDKLGSTPLDLAWQKEPNGSARTARRLGSAKARLLFRMQGDDDRRQRQLHIKELPRPTKQASCSYTCGDAGRGRHRTATGRLGSRTATPNEKKAATGRRRAVHRGAHSRSRGKATMPRRVLMAAATALALLMVRLGPARHNMPTTALAFSPNKAFATRPRSCSVVALHMGRKKGSGGRLGNMVDVDMLESSSSSSPSPTAPAANAKQATSKGKRSGTRKEKSAATSSPKTAAAGGISPLLAQWAAEKTPANRGDDEEGNETAGMAPPPTRDASDNSRRQRQSQRKELEKERDGIVQQTVESIEAMLSDDDDAADDDNNNNSKDDNKKKKKEPFKVETMLARIRELLELTSSSAVGSSSNNSNLRQLAAGSGTTDYRLAWVGSDEAMCHLGTGLHKVALARLQEVFLTVGPKSRVQMYEVIRILGPFPNVRNTLVGTSAVDKPRGGGDQAPAQPWRITWQSLVDGTGKEILAGSQVRNVDMEVLWCDASLLLCAAKFADTASTEGTNEDPLHDDGRDLFVFVRESKMESKLDALRVI
jgi:hypothetical protein